MRAHTSTTGEAPADLSEAARVEIAKHALDVEARWQTISNVVALVCVSFVITVIVLVIGGAL